METARARAGVSPKPAARIFKPNPILPYENTEDSTPNCRVDELVFSELHRKNISPAPLCSDSVFIRRLFIDTIGTLPTSAEVRTFLLSSSPHKRAALIDSLFVRDEFAQYWATYWCDVLRVKSEFPVNLWPLAAQNYHRWVRTALRDNMPYDKFVYLLLTDSGSNFDEGPVNFYRSVPGRKPETIAQYVALTFMGTRAEKWPVGRLKAMAPFFSQITFKGTDEWKEELVLWDPAKQAASVGSAPLIAVFPAGEQVAIPAGQDPRKVFADWLINPANPWLARCVVNRIWCWLMGRGIIHEPDDIRHDNLPSNAPLLAYLERVLINEKFDLRAVYRVILNSKTYRLSSIPHESNPAAAAVFASYPIRRLDAEVLIDAIDQVSGSGEVYQSEIPEPFTFLPSDQRAIDLPDGSISSVFLELFGRPGRDTGLYSERDNRLTSAHIRTKIERIPDKLGLLNGNLPVQSICEELYLSILSRFPTDQETATARSYITAPRQNRRSAVIDVAWSMINSAEFLFRH
jgi:hypothetical protein